MDNFERLLSLAEFAAKRHEERRQVEFKIFIAYLTFLAVIFYHLTKKEGLARDLITWLGVPATSSPDPINPWVFVALSLIHVVYFFWQATIGIANQNDTRRRDFFLERAECIAQCYEKKVLVERDGEETRETEFFAKQGPQIILPPYSIPTMIEYSHKFLEDWFRGSQFAIPTIMLGTLFFLKLDFWWQGLLTLVLLAILSVFLPLVSFCWRKRKRNDN